MSVEDPNATSGSHPLHTSRRRFTALVTSGLAVSLSKSGYGFVPAQALSSNPLLLPMTTEQLRMMEFLAALPNDLNLQATFVEDPTGTLIAHNVITGPHGTTVSQSNRLLLYILGNKKLLKEVGVAAEYHRIPELSRNLLTTNNINVEPLADVDAEIVNDSYEWRFSLAKQISVMLFDPTVQKILNVRLENSEVDSASYKLADVVIQQSGPNRVHPDAAIFVVAIANVIALANIKYVINANVGANVNISANANANFNYNANYNFSGSSGAVVGPNRAVESWDRFLHTLQAHANVVSAKEQEDDHG